MYANWEITLWTGHACTRLVSYIYAVTGYFTQTVHYYLSCSCIKFDTNIIIMQCAEVLTGNHTCRNCFIRFLFCFIRFHTKTAISREIAVNTSISGTQEVNNYWSMWSSVCLPHTFTQWQKSPQSSFRVYNSGGSVFFFPMEYCWGKQCVLPRPQLPLPG